MHAPRRFAMVLGVRLDRWVGRVIDCVDTMRELWGCVAGDLPGAPQGGKLTDGPVHDFGKASFQRTGNQDVRGEGRRRVQEKAARKSDLTILCRRHPGSAPPASATGISPLPVRRVWPCALPTGACAWTEGNEHV